MVIFHSYASLPEGNNPLFCGTPIKAKQRSASGQIVEHQGGKPKSLSSWSHQNRKGRLREHSDFFFLLVPLKLCNSCVSLVAWKNPISTYGSVNMLFWAAGKRPLNPLDTSWSIIFICLPRCLMVNHMRYPQDFPLKSVLDMSKEILICSDDIPRVFLVLWDPYKIELVWMEPSDLQAFKAPSDPPLMPGGASEGLPGGNHNISTIIYIICLCTI